MERRYTKAGAARLATREDGDAAPQKIAGCGAVTYDGTEATEYELWGWGDERCVERILPGAFDKALARPDDCRGLFNHDANQVLGRTKSGTMRLSVDAQGLQYEIDPDDTNVSRDVQKYLKRGDVSGSSIAFVVNEERWTETKLEDGSWLVLREIISVTLYDVGPVTFPAYGATTSSVRAAGDVEEAKRSLELKRSRDKGDATAVAGRLAAYAARARACSLAE